jgi:hypothetical protein
MRRIRFLKPAILIAPIVLLLIVGGCSDNRCTEVHCCQEAPTLENIWPNDDQTAWTYDYQFSSWEWTGWTVYDNEDDVPPAPTLDEVLVLLFVHDTGKNPVTSYGLYGLHFDGDTTTLSGVTAQNLRETLVPIEDDAITAGPGLETSALPRPAPSPAQVADPLLVRLAIARPDLRDAIAEALGPRGETFTSAVESLARKRSEATAAARDLLGQALREPYFIHGYAWRKTSEWIGTYGDVDTLLAWKFLEADLTPGHEFIHRLVPGLADDVFLHCRVLGTTRLETPAGVFLGALECLYIIDYGVAMLLTPADGVGWSRTFEYGTAVYVPTVGPVYTYQRLLGDVADPHSAGYGEIRVGLSDATTLNE